MNGWARYERDGAPADDEAGDRVTDLMADPTAAQQFLREEWPDTAAAVVAALVTGSITRCTSSPAWQADLMHLCDLYADWCREQVAR